MRKCSAGEMDSTTLEKIGLTKNESITYLALARSGLIKTSEILQISGLNSGRIYDTLESLKHKGLVSESVIDGIKHFAASSPNQLKEYYLQRLNQLRNEEPIIEDAIRDLNKIRNTTIAESRSVIYTGLRGLRTAVDEAFEGVNNDEEILGMGVTSLKDDSINRFWANWQQKRITEKIVAKHLFSEKSDYYIKFKKMKYTESKILKGMTPVTVDIFGTKTVLIMNYKEPISCILIQDDNTVQSFRHFFFQLWKIARE
jgi:sugar-specific transcriptional regulator TrmB